MGGKEEEAVVKTNIQAIKHELYRDEFLDVLKWFEIALAYDPGAIELVDIRLAKSLYEVTRRRMPGFVEKACKPKRRKLGNWEPLT